MSYENNTKAVLDYLSDNSCSQTLYSLSNACFAQFGRYLEENGIGYSRESAEEWINSCPQKSTGTMKAYKKALMRLDDVFSVGHIRFPNRYRLSLAYPFEKLISEYLSEISSRYTESHLRNIRYRCRFFFGFLQWERVHSSLDSIGYDDILSFYSGAKEMLTKADFCLYKGSVADLLSWMSRRELCPRGLSMLLFFSRAEKALSLSEFPVDSSRELQRIGGPRFSEFPPDSFLASALDFRQELKRAGYADSMMNSAGATLDLLYLFLDMNHLGYDPFIASVWFGKASVFFGKNYLMSRRVLGLFRVYVQEGSVHPENVFRYKPLLCESLPEWCRRPLDLFLSQKKKEHLADSTVSMYRSAATRFCAFLTGTGKTSFSQITSDDLKEFNLTDPHATAEGRNAYNVRIRRFLLFLAENGYVDNYYLREALPCTSAPRTRVVRILTGQEIQTLREAWDGDGALKLRNRAIILIGLRMGMRGSDITALEISDIDWKSQAIRFCQKKTGVGKVLPMPTEVGNAIYRYLTEGRPASSSKYVFITHKAPYKKVCRDVCKGIMKRAFPQRDGMSPGFHATRRTYASDRFRNGCGYSQVADLLGHSTEKTVHKYLALDEENMRKCPIPLASAGILMEGGFRNE